MSKAAFTFLAATVICSLMVTLSPSSEVWSMAGKIGLALFGTLFFGALLVGRKIKFDPVLR